MAKLSELIKEKNQENSGINNRAIPEIPREVTYSFKGEIIKFSNPNEGDRTYIEVISNVDKESWEMTDKEGKITYVSIPWRKRINFDTKEDGNLLMWNKLREVYSKNPDTEYTFYVEISAFNGKNGIACLALWFKDVEF